MATRLKYHCSIRRGIAFLLTAAALGSAGFAGTSLRLGATFPGWNELGSFGEEGRLEDAMIDLARDYASQLGGYCTLPEVFVREGSSSLITALVFYEGYLPYGAREEILLDSYDQRVSVVHLNRGAEALVVLITLDGFGVGMTVCGI